MDFSWGNSSQSYTKFQHRCDEHGHYTRKCLRQKKQDNEKKKEIAMVATYTAEQDDFMRRFEEDFSLVSHFFEGTIDEGTWFIDSGLSKHTTRSQEVFETLTEWDSILHVEVDEKSQKTLKGSGMVPFKMEARGLLQVHDALWVHKLMCSMLSVLVIKATYNGPQKLIS